jgi:hypothetical protein
MTDQETIHQMHSLHQTVFLLFFLDIEFRNEGLGTSPARPPVPERMTKSFISSPPVEPKSTTRVSTVPRSDSDPSLIPVPPPIPDVNKEKVKISIIR